MTRLALLLFLMCSASFLEARPEPVDAGATAGREVFDPTRDADKDIQDAILKAGNSGRRILIDVGGEWCIWCKRLDGFFADHPRLKRVLMKNFVVVKVNYSKENKNEAVLSRYPAVPGYPHFFVLEADGRLLHSQDTGVFEEGKSYSEAKLMTFLKTWTPVRKAK